ncbi:flavoprotein [Streptomyces sp. NPDC014622]|uniref:flavoprotein n=1 Tax=Streptomyces sp. NPDC014622 TaxID=3364874 RepID=UPI0036FEC6CE
MAAPGTPEPDPALAVPPLDVTRLLLVATGSTAAAWLPVWAEWLRVAYPALTVRAVVTRSAERFVTRQALAARLGSETLLDVWPDEPSVQARHVELAAWAEAVVVYPATFGFIARLALGLADSPALLAAQCTDVPLGVAPALPPGGTTSPAYRAHVALLEARPNVVVGPPVRAVSQTTGKAEAWAPLPLPHLLARVEERRVLLAEAAGDGPGTADMGPAPAPGASHDD